MRFTGKTRIIVSSLLFVVLFSSLGLKSAHHYGSHDHRAVCDSKDAKHFHENHERTCCAICDFFFSAFKAAKTWLVSCPNKFPSHAEQIINDFKVTTGWSFCYSLRAPPSC